MANVVKGIYDFNRVWIRTMTTGNLNGVRAATHIYNLPGEVDRLLEAVAHVSTNAGAVQGDKRAEVTVVVTALEAGALLVRSPAATPPAAPGPATLR